MNELQFLEITLFTNEAPHSENNFTEGSQDVVEFDCIPQPEQYYFYAL